MYDDLFIAVYGALALIWLLNLMLLVPLFPSNRRTTLRVCSIINLVSALASFMARTLFAEFAIATLVQACADVAIIICSLFIILRR